MFYLGRSFIASYSDTFENFAAAPPPRLTYLDPSNPDTVEIMLEDESGRLRLTGSLLRATHLVTGVIIAALGTENANGDFDIIDIKVPDFPVQSQRWERAPSDKTDEKLKRTENTSKSSKIAFVSGLGMNGSSGDTLPLELLTEYLLGYTGEDGEEDVSPARISRLVIAGNSLGDVETVSTAVSADEDGTKKKNAPRKYGYDASTYNASPIIQLDNFLSEILPTIPVTLMPGETDPANFSLPQQSIHRAMLPTSRTYCSDGQPGDKGVEPGWFDNVTNPWEGYVDGWRLWGCSGQNVDDVLRYLDFADEDGNVTAGNDGETRVRIMEAMLRWRCAVPTAPDTICRWHISVKQKHRTLIDYRVLSFSNTRPFYLAGLSAPVFHRQPARVQKCGCGERTSVPTEWDGLRNGR